MIEWDESLSVGHELLDKQHQKLIELTNILIDNSNAAFNSRLISESLDELMKYSKYHFQTEERILKNCNFSLYQEHIKEHEMFILKISSFCLDVIENKQSVTEEMIQFLSAWLLDHFAVKDQQYKACI